MLEWWHGSMLGPYEASRAADDAILSGAVAAGSENASPRRRYWVALYAAGQRAVLDHIAGLMTAGLAAAEAKESIMDDQTLSSTK